MKIILTGFPIIYTFITGWEVGSICSIGLKRFIARLANKLMFMVMLSLY